MGLSCRCCKKKKKKVCDCRACPRIESETLDLVVDYHSPDTREDEYDSPHYGPSPPYPSDYEVQATCGYPFAESTNDIAEGKCPDPSNPTPECGYQYDKYTCKGNGHRMIRVGPAKDSTFFGIGLAPDNEELTKNFTQHPIQAEFGLYPDGVEFLEHDGLPIFLVPVDGLPYGPLPLEGGGNGYQRLYKGAKSDRHVGSCNEIDVNNGDCTSDCCYETFGDPWLPNHEWKCKGRDTAPVLTNPTPCNDSRLPCPDGYDCVAVDPDENNGIEGFCQPTRSLTEACYLEPIDPGPQTQRNVNDKLYFGHTSAWGGSNNNKFGVGVFNIDTTKVRTRLYLDYGYHLHYPFDKGHMQTDLVATGCPQTSDKKVEQWQLKGHKHPYPKVNTMAIGNRYPSITSEIRGDLLKKRHTIQDPENCDDQLCADEFGPGWKCAGEPPEDAGDRPAFYYCEGYEPTTKHGKVGSGPYFAEYCDRLAGDEEPGGLDGLPDPIPINWNRETKKHENDSYKGEDDPHGIVKGCDPAFTVPCNKNPANETAFEYLDYHSRYPNRVGVCGNNMDDWRVSNESVFSHDKVPSGPVGGLIIDKVDFVPVDYNFPAHTTSPDMWLWPGLTEYGPSVLTFGVTKNNRVYIPPVTLPVYMAVYHNSKIGRKPIRYDELPVDQFLPPENGWLENIWQLGDIANPLDVENIQPYGSVQYSRPVNGSNETYFRKGHKYWAMTDEDYIKKYGHLPKDRHWDMPSEETCEERPEIEDTCEEVQILSRWSMIVDPNGDPRGCNDEDDGDDDNIQCACKGHLPVTEESGDWHPGKQGLFPIGCVPSPPVAPGEFKGIQWKRPADIYCTNDLCEQLGDDLKCDGDGNCVGRSCPDGYSCCEDEDNVALHKCLPIKICLPPRPGDPINLQECLCRSRGDDQKLTKHLFDFWNHEVPFPSNNGDVTDGHLTWYQAELDQYGEVQLKPSINTRERDIQSKWPERNLVGVKPPDPQNTPEPCGCGDYPCPPGFVCKDSLCVPGEGSIISTVTYPPLLYSGGKSGGYKTLDGIKNQRSTDDRAIKQWWFEQPYHPGTPVRAWKSLGGAYAQYLAQIGVPLSYNLRGDNYLRGYDQDWLDQQYETEQQIIAHAQQHPPKPRGDGHPDVREVYRNAVDPVKWDAATGTWIGGQPGQIPNSDRSMVGLPTGSYHGRDGMLRYNIHPWAQIYDQIRITDSLLEMGRDFYEVQKVLSSIEMECKDGVFDNGTPTVLERFGYEEEGNLQFQLNQPHGTHLAELTTPRILNYRPTAMMPPGNATQIKIGGPGQAMCTYEYHYPFTGKFGMQKIFRPGGTVWGLADAFPFAAGPIPQGGQPFTSVVCGNPQTYPGYGGGASATPEEESFTDGVVGTEFGNVEFYLNSHSYQSWTNITQYFTSGQSTQKYDTGKVYGVSKWPHDNVNHYITQGSINGEEFPPAFYIGGHGYFDPVDLRANDLQNLDPDMGLFTYCFIAGMNDAASLPGLPRGWTFGMVGGSFHSQFNHMAGNGNANAPYWRTGDFQYPWLYHPGTNNPIGPNYGPVDELQRRKAMPVFKEHYFDKYDYPGDARDARTSPNLDANVNVTYTIGDDQIGESVGTFRFVGNIVTGTLIDENSTCEDDGDCGAVSRCGVGGIVVGNNLVDINGKCVSDGVDLWGNRAAEALVKHFMDEDMTNNPEEFLKQYYYAQVYSIMEDGVIGDDTLKIKDFKNVAKLGPQNVHLILKREGTTGRLIEGPGSSRYEGYPQPPRYYKTSKYQRGEDEDCIDTYNKECAVGGANTCGNPNDLLEANDDSEMNGIADQIVTLPDSRLAGLEHILPLADLDKYLQYDDDDDEITGLKDLGIYYIANQYGSDGSIAPNGQIITDKFLRDLHPSYFYDYSGDPTRVSLRGAVLEQKFNRDGTRDLTGRIFFSVGDPDERPDFVQEEYICAKMTDPVTGLFNAEQKVVEPLAMVYGAADMTKCIKTSRFYSGERSDYVPLYGNRTWPWIQYDMPPAQAAMSWDGDDKDILGVTPFHWPWAIGDVCVDWAAGSPRRGGNMGAGIDGRHGFNHKNALENVKKYYTEAIDKYGPMSAIRKRTVIHNGKHQYPNSYEAALYKLAIISGTTNTGDMEFISDFHRDKDNVLSSDPGCDLWTNIHDFKWPMESDTGTTRLKNGADDPPKLWYHIHTCGGGVSLESYRNELGFHNLVLQPSDNSLLDNNIICPTAHTEIPYWGPEIEAKPALMNRELITTEDCSECTSSADCVAPQACVKDSLYGCKVCKDPTPPTNTIRTPINQPDLLNPSSDPRPRIDTDWDVAQNMTWNPEYTPSWGRETCGDDAICQDRLTNSPQYSDLRDEYPWVTAEDCYCLYTNCKFISGCPDGYEGVTDTSRGGLGRYCKPIPNHNVPGLSGTVEIASDVTGGFVGQNGEMVETVIEKVKFTITKLVSDTTDPDYLSPLAGSIQTEEITDGEDGWSIQWDTTNIHPDYTTDGVFQIEIVVYDNYGQESPSISYVRVQNDI